MIDSHARRTRQQHLERLRAIGHRNTVHAGSPSHFQIENRVPDHQGALGTDATVLKNLMNHERIRLAGRLVGTTGYIEEITPALPCQHPIQPAPPFTRRHGKLVPLITKVL